VLIHWPTFLTVGPRYTAGITRGKELTATPNSARYVFANAGLPDALLDTPVPPSGMRELCAQHGVDYDALMAGKLPEQLTGSKPA
jgi:hypothetical protein